MFREGDVITCTEFSGYGRVVRITAEGLVKVVQVMAGSGKPYRKVPERDELSVNSVRLVTREGIERQRTAEIQAINKKYNAVLGLFTRE